MLSRLTNIFAVLLLAAGCADAFSLMRLRRGLVKEFPNDTIGVSLTDGVALTVTFVKDSSAEAPCDNLTAFALRVAALVRRHYQGFESLQTVSIAFAHRGADGSTKTTSSHLPFRFSRAALGIAYPPASRGWLASHGTRRAVPWRDTSVLLSGGSAARRYFETLTPSHRRRYFAWIESAKREETKLRRLQEAIRLMASGKVLGLK